MAMCAAWEIGPRSPGEHLAKSSWSPVGRAPCGAAGRADGPTAPDPVPCRPCNSTLPRISAAAARRIALAAQGFAEPRPAGNVERRHVRRLAERIGLFQIDSVNTLVRAHELPAFARLGPYRRSLLKESTERHRDLFEYWGHAACLMPVGTQPLWRWRMDGLRQAESKRIDRIEQERPGYTAAVLAEVRDRGPISAGDLTDGGTAKGPWWGWAHGKSVIEWLFWVGDLSVAGRRNGFERVYDLTERVIPAKILAAPTPSIEEAHRELVLMAARALGVATRRDIFTYFYLRADRTAKSIAELVEAKELLPVTVEGWSDQAYLAAGARRPRRLDARALVSPFDSLVFDRERVERLFGMRYRIELYTPAPQADLRLLRPAVPPRGQARRASGPQVGPSPANPSRPGRPRRTRHRRHRKSPGRSPTSCDRWPHGWISRTSKSDRCGDLTGPLATTLGSGR